VVEIGQEERSIIAIIQKFEDLISKNTIEKWNAEVDHYITTDCNLTAAKLPHAVNIKFYIFLGSESPRPAVGQNNIDTLVEYIKEFLNSLVNRMREGKAQIYETMLKTDANACTIFNITYSNLRNAGMNGVRRQGEIEVYKFVTETDIDSYDSLGITYHETLKLKN